MTERVAGNRGVKSVTHDPDHFLLHNFKTAESATVVTADTVWDQTCGIAQLLMLGNGPDPENPPYYPNGCGDCVPVSVQNGRYFQALTGKTAEGEPIFVEGFRRPHTQWVLLERYFRYGYAMGERGTPPAPESAPDDGSDPGTYASWVIGQDAEIEFTAEIDISNIKTDPDAVILAIKQAAVDFNGVAFTVDLYPGNENQFELVPPVPFSVIEGEIPSDGHGIWLDAFGPDYGQIATWAWADQRVTIPWLVATLTSARVYGTKQDAKRAGYDYEAWLAVAKTMPGFEQVGTTASDSDSFRVPSLIEAVESGIHRLADAVPGDVKGFVKEMHKITDAAMERESVDLLVALFKDAVKTYFKHDL